MGGAYKGILFLILVFAGIIYVLFGDLSAFGSMNAITDWLFRILTMEDLNSGGMIVVQAVLPYASAGFYYLSYRLSCTFYLKGVGTYDK